MAGGGSRRSDGMLLGTLVLVIVCAAFLYTSGSLQHTTEAHVEVTTLREVRDSRQLIQQAALAAAGEDADDDLGDGAAAAAAAAVPVAAEPGGGATAAAGAPGGCGRELKPYHVLITSSSGAYQQWQTRIMYYHVVEIKRTQGPCGEIGGITRLLTMPGGRPDELMDVMPTYVVTELKPGAEDLGFVVMNRPHSVRALLRDAEAAARLIKEEYVMIAETDHVWLRPVVNVATPTVPLAYHFGYMEAHFRAPLIDRFCAGASKTMDPVGPSPLLVSVQQLSALVDGWNEMSHTLKTDPDADSQLGWVLEMWGYSISTACAGIRHAVSATLQFEGGSIGSHDRPLLGVYDIVHYTYGMEYSAAGVPMELQVGHWSLDKRHYGGSYPPLGLSPPPRCADERARVLTAAFNNASANQRAVGLPPWPEAGGGGELRDGSGTRVRIGSDTWHVRPEQLPVSAAVLEHSALARTLLGTGPWRWQGAGCCGGGEADTDGASGVSLFFMRDGFVWSEMGSGTWRVQGAAAADGGGAAAAAEAEAEVAIVDFIGQTSRLTFTLEPGGGGDGGGGGWSFRSSVVELSARAQRGAAGGAAGKGTLEAPPAVLARWAPPVPPPPPLARARVDGGAGAEETVAAARLQGSGFYRTWGCLLRAGVAWRGRHAIDEWQLWRVRADPHAPDPAARGVGGSVHSASMATGVGLGRATDQPGGWGEGVLLELLPLSRGAEVPTSAWAAPPAAAPAAAAAPPLATLDFVRCWAFVESSMPAGRPPHEWVIPAAAKRVIPGCSGTLPKLGRFLGEGHELAQWLLHPSNKPGWAWAGIKGMHFEPEGVLTTPWGHGSWGLVPGHDGQLAFANFAAQVHVLDFGRGAAAAAKAAIGGGEGGPPGPSRFHSSRCSDGENVEGLRVTE